MNDCQELAITAQELGLAYQILTGEIGANYINGVINRFKPARLEGHLAIHHDSLSIPFEEYEVTYPEFMKNESTYIFFEQSRQNKNCVFILEDAKKLGSVLENTYRFEYFQSNANFDYLLAINWYVIEGTGTALDWMNSLHK